MKRIFCFVTAAAMISLTSCRQEELGGDNVNDKSFGIADNPVFTASISETKTVVDVSGGKVSWESDDKISVSDEAGHIAVYKIADGGIDETTGKAKFVCESGDPLNSGSSYSATYGTGPSTDQTYSAQAGKLYMTAPATTTGSFSFSVQCGLLKLTLTKAGESIKRIAVTGTPTGGEKTTYTLSCSTPIDISEGTDFYIALPGGTYSKFVLKNASDCICTLNATNGIAVSTNKIKPVSISTKIAFYPVPEGALSGEFSVADGRRVRFSKGNLQYQASTGTWRFAEHQYDIIGDNPGNNTETGRESQSKWIDLFGWGATGLNTNGQPPYSTSRESTDYKTVSVAVDQEKLTLDNKGDWGVCMGEGWRTLTGGENGEWMYLLRRTVNGDQGAGHSFQRAAIKTDDAEIPGLILYPDDYTSQTGATSYTCDEWQAMEKDGCVFLPSAGYRDVCTVHDAGGSGNYWSATSFLGNSRAHYVVLAFSDWDECVCRDQDRFYGFSVRLVSTIADSGTQDPGTQAYNEGSDQSDKFDDDNF